MNPVANLLVELFTVRELNHFIEFHFGSDTVAAIYWGASMSDVAHDVTSALRRRGYIEPALTKMIKVRPGRQSDIESVQRKLSLTKLGTSSIIVDLGSVHEPGVANGHLAEVRFSITNASQERIKITSIEIEPLECHPISETQTTLPRGPIIEDTLFARLTPSSVREIISKSQYLLEEGETYGYKIALHLEEGFTYDFAVWAHYHHVPRQFVNASPDHLAGLSRLSLSRPSSSPEALLRLAQRRQG